MRASYEGSASPFICSSVKALHVTDCCHSVETTDRKQQLIDHLQLGQTNIWINIAACLCVCPSLCMSLFFSLLSLSLSDHRFLFSSVSVCLSVFFSLITAFYPRLSLFLSAFSFITAFYSRLSQSICLSFSLCFLSYHCFLFSSVCLSLSDNCLLFSSVSVCLSLFLSLITAFYPRLSQSLSLFFSLLSL